ncbi:MAG: hypothetical protein A3C07_01190 [Candidatus Sungbacteria bacterium RIFCSPHIGHO2_02_FULL_47_11]|uniref:Uncharacterized protein n=1 Tax=Candidatus Sungbacteria bacterium RIFCSPHIGHO2_02_FULL_47_11 TaxID=1802270 RepID=A0A1G2KGI5_9BACT|nr:MAG: hypothetical protein A3C07_01190 [Candidatus Sungbacteria bacterium RIFCSPHIGHO2_02_FULL_47_11]
MYLTIASAKTMYSEAEKKRLEELGYTVWRSRGRYYASRPIQSFEEVATVWGKEFFDFLIEGTRYPEIIGVRFEEVTCHSVRHHVWGQMSGVIMIDPDNPIHTELFPFTLKLCGRPILRK